jgi:signal transduction histidine kinase
MSKAGSIANLVRSVADWMPACQWSFNQVRCFDYVGGDAMPIFHRTGPELLRRHVSTIDDAKRSWAIRLDRIFSGESRRESTAPAFPAEYTITHLPVHGPDGAVAYAAGFAYRAGQPVPSAAELEFTALAILQALDAERVRTDRFLHDVIAQCLTSTGLELEVQRLEVKALGMELPERAREIQRSLEEALNQIREFRLDQKTRTV